MTRVENRIAVTALVAMTPYIGLSVAANAARKSERGLVDKAPPETQIVKAKVRRARGFARFRFTSSKPGSTFRCRLDRQRFRACDSPKTYRHLRNGRHVFRIKA